MDDLISERVTKVQAWGQPLKTGETYAREAWNTLEERPNGDGISISEFNFGVSVL
jgi:hypothetical protein